MLSQPGKSIKEVTKEKKPTRFKVQHIPSDATYVTPTPTPWIIRTEHTMYECVVLGPDKNGARDVIFQGDLATAKFLVKACNNFAAMRELLARAYIKADVNVKDLAEIKAVLDRLNQ